MFIYILIIYSILIKCLFILGKHETQNKTNTDNINVLYNNKQLFVKMIHLN